MPSNARREWRGAKGWKMQTGAAIPRPLQAVCWAAYTADLSYINFDHFKKIWEGPAVQNAKGSELPYHNEYNLKNKSILFCSNSPLAHKHTDGDEQRQDRQVGGAQVMNKKGRSSRQVGVKLLICCHDVVSGLIGQDEEHGKRCNPDGQQR